MNGSPFSRCVKYSIATFYKQKCLQGSRGHGAAGSGGERGRGSRGGGRGGQHGQQRLPKAVGNAPFGAPHMMPMPLMNMPTQMPHPVQVRCGILYVNEFQHKQNSLIAVILFNSHIHKRRCHSNSPSMVCRHHNECPPNATSNEHCISR